jgi:hypothetical protein
LTPTSSGWSRTVSPAGASLGAKIVHGHWAGVLKVHVLSAASRLPATSVTPALPLLIVAV